MIRNTQRFLAECDVAQARHLLAGPWTWRNDVGQAVCQRETLRLITVALNREFNEIFAQVRAVLDGSHRKAATRLMHEARTNAWPSMGQREVQCVCSWLFSTGLAHPNTYRSACAMRNHGAPSASDRDHDEISVQEGGTLEQEAAQQTHRSGLRMECLTFVRKPQDRHALCPPEDKGIGM